MVEEGSLDWDDHIQTYIKDFRMKDTSAASRMTVRNILSHTTGFPEHTYTDYWTMVMIMKISKGRWPEYLPLQNRVRCMVIRMLPIV